MKCGLSISRILLLMLLFPGAFPVSLDAQDKKRVPDQIGNREVGSGVNFYSLEKEVALGKQLAQEVERSAKVFEDPVVAEFINRMAQNLGRNSDLTVPVTAKVIDGNQVNAFALPGAFLFVYSGLILETETEAELAATMSHEIAHAAARHGTRQASRGQVANLASIPLIFLGGWPGFIVRQGAGVAVPLAFLKFSRGFEAEADLLGVQYLYKAGYDPLALINFFERLQALQKKKPEALSEIFSSHPKVEDRIKATQKNIADMLAPQPQYVLTTSEFLLVKNRLVEATSQRKRLPRKEGPTLRRPEERNEADERPTLKRRGS
jgi:predicted Zn-dependent protease